MGPLGQGEGHHPAVLELPGDPPLGDLVVAGPDRPEAEDGDLLGIPVGQAVEAEDLAQGGVAGCVPALVRVVVGIRGGGEEGREQFRLLHEVDEVCRPLGFEVVVEDAVLALALEEVDGGAQQAASSASNCCGS